MRFVAVKSEAVQASAAIFRTRDLLVRQRTQLVNAIRGQLTEYGLVTAKGPANLSKLLEMADDAGSALPQAARAMLDVLADMVATLTIRVTELAAALVRQTSRRDPPAGSWLARMLARKPRMLVITALANKMARTVWALLTRNEVFRAPAVIAA